MRIYLADLGHNLLTLSSDTYPLGVGNIAMYLREYLDAPSELDISIYREPQDLKAALDAAPPDVLGLSNYAWNEELSLQFARFAKALRPDMLCVMGGPNWPLVESVQEDFLRRATGIDVYIDGPTYEGERGMLNLIRRFVDVGQRVEGIFEEQVAANAWIDPSSGAFVKGAPETQIRDLDEIPSPYLAGLMDPYFETGYFPLMQISRGCPFTCSFCNSGVTSNSKVRAHSIERVLADLDYISERVKPDIALCFADDNFGMYPRDEEIADYIGHLQNTRSWPKYIRTTTGKNKGDRIIRVMRKVRGTLPMTSAVQSMNPVVLENIKRKNIKLETYQELQEELKGQGMKSYGELIMCLPGETRESFLDAVEKFLDSGAKRVSSHQLMLLHGAELANPESRERFGLNTRWRVVARNIGDYIGEPVIEVEEMVVETPTISFDTYLELRNFHLLLTIFFYEGNFEESFEFAHKMGLKPFDLCVQLLARLDEAPAEFRAVLDDFEREGKEELFDSRNEVLAWASEKFEGLVSGDIGGNLLSKYSMIGRFYATAPAIDFLHASIAAGLEECAAEYDPEQLSAVIDYQKAVALCTPFAETIQADVEWTSRWDVDAWIASGFEGELAEHRFETKRTFVGKVDAERRSLIMTKVETFGEHPSGLGKFTRTMFARDLRRRLEAQ